MGSVPAPSQPVVVGNISVDFISFHVGQPDYNDSPYKALILVHLFQPARATSMMISFALRLGHFLELAFYFHFHFSPASLPNCVQTKVCICTSLEPCRSQKGDSGIGKTGLKKELVRKDINQKIITIEILVPQYLLVTVCISA